MALIRSFRDLEAYKLALRQAGVIFVRTRRFPRDETYSLTSQIRRSSRAVGAMISEAWARRRYPAVFTNKIDEALGEATETQAWLDHARECGYVNDNEYGQLNDAWQHVGAMLSRMISRAEDFCRAAAK
jgi:four helix bundle protein